MNTVTKVPRVLKYRYDKEYQLSISGVLRENKSIPVRFHVMPLATRAVPIIFMHSKSKKKIFNNVFNVIIYCSNFILLDQELKA